jgi:hypothetical protein
MGVDRRACEIESQVNVAKDEMRIEAEIDFETPIFRAECINC